MVSFVFSAIAVIVSAAIVVGLSTIESPEAAMTTSGGTRVVEIAGAVFGSPLVGGFLFVSLVFGEWRAFHQAGILLLIPLISVVVDGFLIFLIWEFFHRRKSGELKSESILHLDR
jgi:hypothetical protein